MGSLFKILVKKMSIAAKLSRKLLSQKTSLLLSARMMSEAVNYSCKALNVTQPAPFVFGVELNRPKKMNVMNKVMWEEIGDVFTKLDRDPDCRAVVLSGSGKMFTSGIDLSDLSQLASIVYGEDDIARKSMQMYTTVRHLQDLLTTIEKCKKPVISCVHNACVGAAVDIRLCTSDSWFCVKEVDMGLAADVGTLQRLPKVIGSQSLVNDLCLTARKMKSDEAEKCGLISRTYADKEELMKNALELAKQIASKSPVAVQGTKMHLVYSREHTVAEGLRNMSTWNMSMLQSEDVMKSAMASMNKDESAEFSKF